MENLNWRSGNNVDPWKTWDISDYL